MKQAKKFCSVSIKSTGLLTCLSVSTMCLLIFTTIVIITVISVTPIIILGLGQINAGQRDVIIQPSDPLRDFMNTTKITDLTNQIAMPRLRSMVTLDKKYGIGWFMDLSLQKQQHLGTLPIVQEYQPSEHFVYVHQQFGFKEGENISIGLRSDDLLIAINNTMNRQKPQNYKKIRQQIQFLILNNIRPKGTFQIVGVYDQAMGKFALGQDAGTVYLNISSAFQHMVKQTYQKQKLKNSLLPSYIQTINLAEYATEATINLPNRIQVYENSDYQQTYNTLSSFGANILDKLGLFSVQTRIPIAENLIAMSYFGMFIGVILKLIIISLFTLSVLMMNNMLNVGIQRKNFDFAVLKTMGANRIFVIVNILIDSIKYVVIANVIAYPFAYMCMGLISQIFITFFGYYYNVQPTFASILGGFFIGVLVPIISSIAPIWGVINNDLAENLNPIRNKTQSIKTQIYVQGAEFPVGKFIYGIISASFGLMIYYLLPKAMINQDIGLLLFVFFTILVGLLLGLILISYSFQYLVEKIIAYVTLFWVNKTDFILVMKNLSAHRFKNRKTSLLYALSVSLIIFVSVGLSIQMQTIQQQMLKQHGTYLQIRSHMDALDRQYYDELFATKFKKQIIDWAYQTSSINNFMGNSMKIRNVLFSDKAKLYFKNSRLYGVTPNFLKVMAHTEQSMPITKSYAYQPYDPYQFLYTPDGYMTCTISQYLAKKFNLLNTDNREFYMSLYQQQAVQRTILNVSTILNKRAGLGYSRYGFGRHEMGVSFDTYAKISGVRSYSQIPLQKLKVKVLDPDNTKQLANKLRNEIMFKNMDSLWDYSQVKQTIDKIQNLLDNILNILLVLVLLISFFSLVTTSFINIINQKTEIAILMTLGYTKFRIFKIYIYEAFVLVLNSCLIGIAVGTFVAWMMGLQRQLFGDYPVNIQIKGIWIIGLAAIVSSILSTIWPIRKIFSQSINQIFKTS